jgi:hypothetical protein
MRASAIRPVTLNQLLRSAADAARDEERQAQAERVLRRAAALRRADAPHGAALATRKS